jgi:hypothetical protein
MDKQTPKIGAGKPGPGRPKGLPNKTTALLKDALLAAATKAGGKGGLEAFLLAQARKENNAPFMTLLGKVLPTQLSADAEGNLVPVINVEILRFEHADGRVSAGPPKLIEHR